MADQLCRDADRHQLRLRGLLLGLGGLAASLQLGEVLRREDLLYRRSHRRSHSHRLVLLLGVEYDLRGRRRSHCLRCRRSLLGLLLGLCGLAASLQLREVLRREDLLGLGVSHCRRRSGLRRSHLRRRSRSGLLGSRSLAACLELGEVLRREDLLGLLVHGAARDGQHLLLGLGIQEGEHLGGEHDRHFLNCLDR